MKRIALLLALFAGVSAFAQEGSGDIPADVFYLMPEFGQGMVYFTGQAPAQGKLNICAEDHSLRFLDDKGEEMSSKADNIVRVVIDNVVFVRDDDAFYKIVPVTEGLSGNISCSRYRAFVLSITVTRGSFLSFQSSCP